MARMNNKKMTTSTSTTTPTTRKQPRPQQQLAAGHNKIVRRSRRGDNAKANHPAVGDYAIEITGSENKWCGKFALEISTKAQLGQRLTLEAFDEIFSRKEVKEFSSRHGWTNQDEFYEEQLDLVLRLWGRQRGLGLLQLGVVRDFEGVVVKGFPVETKKDLKRVVEEGSRTLWVHNDNAMLLGRPCNHYSGVTVSKRAV